MYKNELKLIQERSALRTKRLHLLCMAQDIKSSVQFKEMCLKRVDEINKKLDELKQEITKERKNY